MASVRPYKLSYSLSTKHTSTPQPFHDDWNLESFQAKLHRCLFFHSPGVAGASLPSVGNRIPACIKSPSSRHTQPLPVPPPAGTFAKPLPPPQNNNSNSSLLPVPLTNPTSNTTNQLKVLQSAQSYRWVTKLQLSEVFIPHYLFNFFNFHFFTKFG